MGITEDARVGDLTRGASETFERRRKGASIAARADDHDAAALLVGKDLTLERACVDAPWSQGDAGRSASGTKGTLDRRVGRKERGLLRMACAHRGALFDQAGTPDFEREGGVELIGEVGAQAPGRAAKDVDHVDRTLGSFAHGFGVHGAKRLDHALRDGSSRQTQTRGAIADGLGKYLALNLARHRRGERVGDGVDHADALIGQADLEA